MAKTQDHEVITYKQEIFRIISDKKTLDNFDDVNLGLMLKFLRKRPMTLEELEIAFKEVGKEKSIPSLYRYLQKLGKAGLVIQAGKRMAEDKEGQIKIQTLYMRTARIFFEDIGYKIHRMDKKDSLRKINIIKAIGLLLGQQFAKKKGSEEALSSLLLKIHKRKQEVLEEILATITEKTTGFIAALDWDDVNYVLDTVFWLSLLTEGIPWQEELVACFTEN